MSLSPSQSFRSVLFRTLRFGFRLIPMTEASRDRLRIRFLDRFPSLIPTPGQRQTNHGTAPKGRAYSRSGQQALGYTPRLPGTLPSPLPATLIAFYLPQFHPIPENDTWWGKGFTEWRNVTRALPQFEGHSQPRLPGELGFYDLRNADAMHQQVELAKEYGIGAFCFYFYWFGGKTLLEAPLRQWLADPSLDLPFCLCWANEKWSRRWDGRGDDVLIDQRHGAEDDIAYIAHVADYLRDPRYLRIDGKPLLLVYRPGLLPEAKATAQRWRDWCRNNGVGEIHLGYVQGFERPDPRDIGFDSAIEFPPNLSTPPDITSQQRLLNPEFKGHILDWRALAKEMSSRPMPGYPLFPAVNCGWDNEPRRSGAGRIFLHASPRGYRDWLEETLHKRLAGIPASQRLVFINAWNEWAEGAVLEPDTRLGHAWLEATRQALCSAAPSTTSPMSGVRPCAVVHAWHPELLDEIVQSLQASGIDWRLIVTTAHEREDAVRTRLQALGVSAEIVTGENRGRDILPFLRVAYRLLDEGVEVVLKLHTKRSTHRQDGDAWRRELLDRLAAPGRSTRILEAFIRRPDLGLVAPEGHVQQLAHYQGANRDTVDRLMVRLGIMRNMTNVERFVAGSMYWIRPSSLRPLLDAHLDEWEFEAETGQVDGTMAHAIERIVILATESAGYRMETAAALCGESEPDPDHYPYAKRG